ncbi:4-hydroxy-tetrahydrodipicolinate reductase [Candidatus Igneacidithiobacillus taiwanensis]|uniref:4-hydroxy-tetrahydrodipicolinate reductase n=1 Tax=Candidatus Igneacidithiobacillus taiwanensis TaxID=1945924 RepID=UPI00289EFAB9|nr:4-hydroxy-tetrahydrodipicolinate reductase [Candidatus Igneacidithiobacillus taiwanensis]
MTIRVAVTAAAGKMGKAIIAALTEQADLQLVAALGRPGAAYLGEDAGRLAGGRNLDVPVSVDLSAALTLADVCIDFSPADAALAHLHAAAAVGCPVVVGSTGFTPAQVQEIQQLAQRIPLVVAPNMSVGINVLLAFLPQMVAALGESYDIEILEAHHSQKRDAPSGTALALGRAAAAGRQGQLDELACYDRNGIPGPRQPGSIGFATLRAADVVGEHSIWLAGAGERLELTHRASSRRNFAEGALRAARWLQGQKAGLYDMQDVLGLRPHPGVE